MVGRLSMRVKYFKGKTEQAPGMRHILQHHKSEAISSR